MIIPLKGDKINISENPLAAQQFVVKGLGKKVAGEPFSLPFDCVINRSLKFFIFGDKNSSQFLPDANPFLWNDFLIKSDPPSRTICMGKRVPLIELGNQIQPAYWRWCFMIHPQLRSMGISDRWLKRSVTNRRQQRMIALKGDKVANNFSFELPLCVPQIVRNYTDT